jgi:hypothetical protein
MKTVLAVLALIFMIGMCDRNPNDLQSSMLGRYELTGHDSSGRLLFTGTISLKTLEQNHLKGQCIIKREEGAPEGLLNQQGDCGGAFDGKKVDLDLAPSLDDAGLLLEGELNAIGISGIWRLDGFATSKPLGKFEAVKKE